MNDQKRYQQEISNFINLNNNSIFFYWKGRVGLYAMLKAMNIKEGDEVILPALTCVVVPNAILYLKAKPIYVDVDLNTFNSTFKNIKSAITPKTKVIIVQNTFGLSNEVDEISQFANSNGIYTIEDCTHGFGGRFKGKPNGSYCDAAIYSTQWNKPFSTGIGGFLSLNNLELKERLCKVNEYLKNPKLTEKIILQLLIFLNKISLNDFTYWPLLKLYRFLSKVGLVIGSSSKSELNSTEMNSEYFKSYAHIQIKAGIKELKKLHGILALRKESGVKYTDFLQSINKNHVSQLMFDNHSFLKYPLLVKDRELFFRNAEKARVRLGDWFASPLHPVKDSFENWKLEIEKYPNAKFLSEHLINLPTDYSNIKRVLRFLGINKDLIIDSDKIIN